MDNSSKVRSVSRRDGPGSVVVVGAGISGTSIANSLTKRGVEDVTLVDKQNVASGTTGRSVGVIETQYFSEFEVALRAKCNEVFEDLARETHAEIERCGYVRLLLDETDRRAFERGIELQHAHGIDDACMLSTDEVADLVPELNTADVRGAMYGPSDGYADPATFAQLFARRARGRGATLLTGTTVTGVRTECGAVTGVRTENGTLDCDVVVNAAGPWSPRLARDAGLEIPVAAFRRQVLVAEPPGGLPYTVPMVIESRLANEQPGVYFRDEGGDALLLGYFSDDEYSDPDENPANPDDYSQRYDQSFALKLQERLEHRAPEFAEFPVTNGWAGLHITSADGKPIVDRHPDVDGYYLATGFSGTGFQIAPMTGELMADLIVHGEPRVLDHMKPFRISRFDTRS